MTCAQASVMHDPHTVPARPPVLVDAAAAARWCGVAPGTIYAWASLGKITRHPVPTATRRRCVMYDLNELPAAAQEPAP